MRLVLLLSLLLIVTTITHGKRKKPGKPGKPGKPSKPGKPIKNAFSKFDKYTLKNTGGRCWWDIRRTDCAVCKPGTKAMACGYPMHKYCYKQSDRLGCPGVPNNKYTLSSRGFPCFWDNSDTRCAWCSPGGYQCGPGQKTGPESKQGSRCARGKDKHYCDSVVGDCRHIPACDANADCRLDRPFGTLNIFKCVCKKGYTGNGIQCMDKEGVIGKNPEKIVTVEMDLTTGFFQKNKKDPITNNLETEAFKFPFGAQNKVFDEMENVKKMCLIKDEDCKVNFKQVSKNLF